MIAITPKISSTVASLEVSIEKTKIMKIQIFPRSNKTFTLAINDEFVEYELISDKTGFIGYEPKFVAREFTSIVEIENYLHSITSIVD